MGGAMLAVGMSSCGDAASATMSDVDYLPVQETEGGNWGFLAPDGSLLYADEFKNQPSVVLDGVFSVEEESGYSLYKAGDKKPELIKGMDQLLTVGYYNDGLVPFSRKHERISVADKSGNVKFTINPVKNKEIVTSADAFSEGLLRVCDEEGKYGYVDTNGKMVIEPKFNDAYDFGEGLAIVSTDSGDGTSKIFAIDKKGAEVFKIRKDYRCSNKFKNGYLIAIDANDHVVFLDKKGEVAVKLPSKVKNVMDFNSKYYIYRSKDGVGVNSMEDEQIIRAKYDDIELVGEDEFLCEDSDNKKASLRNKEDEAVFEIEDCRYVVYMQQFGIFARENNYLLYDNEGKPVKGREFNSFGRNYTASSGVRSDFFDAGAVANAVVDMLSADGIDKYTLGANPSKFFQDPSQYTYTSSVTPEDLKKTGYRFEVAGELKFSESMARYDYSNDYYSSTSSYVWNPDSKLESYEIEVEAQSQLGKEAFDALEKALNTKGYKTVKTFEKDGTCMGFFANDKVMIAVRAREESSSMGLEGIAKDDNVLKALKEMKDELDNDALSNAMRQSQAEAVDSVAAEVVEAVDYY